MPELFLVTGLRLAFRHGLKSICLSLAVLSACQPQSRPEIDASVPKTPIAPAEEEIKSHVAPTEEKIKAPAVPHEPFSSQEFSRKEGENFLKLVRESGDHFPLLQVLKIAPGTVEVWTGEDNGFLDGHGIVHVLKKGDDGWLILSSDPWDK